MDSPDRLVGFFNWVSKILILFECWKILVERWRMISHTYQGTQASRTQVYLILEGILNTIIWLVPETGPAFDGNLIRWRILQKNEEAKNFNV